MKRTQNRPRAGVLPLTGLVAGLFVAALAGFAGCTASTPAPTPTAATWGEWPSWLPTPSSGPRGTLTGSQANPALLSQGETVRAELPGGGTVLMTVVGPEVPGVGLPDPPEHTTCTWSITVSGGTVDVPLDVSEFRTRDVDGMVYLPHLIDGRLVPPAVLPAGESVTFELRAIMPAGEGIMQWAPDAKAPVATWDFIVEND